MAALPVEWVLVVYYGPEAHRATYGRQVRSNRYTKDYIQLSRKKEFLDTVKKLFGVNSGENTSVPLTYKWPLGNAPGAFVFKSADRPHLKWETSLGAPKVWKMSLTPGETVSETIPGDPSHVDYDAAENELALLSSRGAGQPYLMAVKLRDEPRTLHLRVYLMNPAEGYAWANIRTVPTDIQELAEKTSQTAALAWSAFQSGGVIPSAKVKDISSQLFTSDNVTSMIGALDESSGRELASYLQQPGYGLFFDPSRNHDAWMIPTRVPEKPEEFIGGLIEELAVRFPPTASGDAIAERLEVSTEEVEGFREQIDQKNFEVPDSYATTKTRGSAQKVFAEAVKANYEFRCAITGIETPGFLIASHIVPWSKDQSIRLDPTNGICLSLLMDRAFEIGQLMIEDDLIIRIDREKIGDDQALLKQLEPYDGLRLRSPLKDSPRPEYLRRRRALY